MNENLISIIVPTFNREHLLKDLLDSVVKQSHTNWECLIVDDGSTDNTEKLVNEYISRDPRFRFYKRPDSRPKGANACRNIGFEKSQGSFVNWFDSDDVMHQDFLKSKYEVLEKDNTLDFCCCISSTFKDDVNTPIKIEKPNDLNSKNYLEDYLLNGFYFYTPSPLWRKGFLNDKDLFDEALHRSQERDFHFRMLTYNPHFQYLEKVLFFVRLGPDSITSKASQSLKSQKSVFRYFDKVFYAVQDNENLSNKSKMLEYVFYRQAVNYYNINQLENNISGRFEIFKTYRKTLFSYASTLKDTSKLKLNLLLGIVLLLVFNKGYSYFYYPKYNHRKQHG